MPDKHPTIVPFPTPERLRIGGRTWDDSEGPWLEDLYPRLLATLPEHRDARINEWCADTPELAQQLRKLTDGKGVEPAAGLTLDKYVLERELGRGATATVWQAFDTQLHRPVALKVFDYALVRRGRGLGRVLAEARATADVQSPFVITVHNVSQDDQSGFFYIEMELCGEFADVSNERQVGTALGEGVEAQSLIEAVRWVQQSARGVHAAHEQGVFHRDLKPSNILVRPVSRRAQVTDFGLAAQQLDPSAGLDAPGTRTVTIMTGKQRRCIAGTPVYMAPEQAHGLPIDLDPEDPQHREMLTRIDVYGLGATLYELIAGHPPYRSSDIGAENLNSLLLRVAMEPPPDLATTDSRWRVPHRLLRIVRKAMSRDPDDRYPSAAALAQDLEAYLNMRPTSTDQPYRALRTWLWTRRHWRALSTATAVLMLVAVTGTSAMVIHQTNTRIDALAAEEAAATERARTARLNEIASKQREKVASVKKDKADKLRAEAEDSAKRAHQARLRAERSRVASEAEADARVKESLSRQADAEEQAARAELEAEQAQTGARLSLEAAQQAQIREMEAKDAQARAQKELAAASAEVLTLDAKLRQATRESLAAAATLDATTQQRDTYERMWHESLEETARLRGELQRARDRYEALSDPDTDLLASPNP